MFFYLKPINVFVNMVTCKIIRGNEEMYRNLVDAGNLICGTTDKRTCKEILQAAIDDNKNQLIMIYNTKFNF